jgi:hypothetical protein
MRLAHDVAILNRNSDAPLEASQLRENENATAQLGNREQMKPLLDA